MTVLCPAQSVQTRGHPQTLMETGCRSLNADTSMASAIGNLIVLVSCLEDDNSFYSRGEAARAICELDDSSQRLIAEAALPDLINLVEVRLSVCRRFISLCMDQSCMGLSFGGPCTSRCCPSDHASPGGSAPVPGWCQNTFLLTACERVAEAWAQGPHVNTAAAYQMYTICAGRCCQALQCGTIAGVVLKHC